jgi:hypothetical protein
VLESIALRHQIAVLERSRTYRPCFRRFDRRFWILLSRWWSDWRKSLVIVQPETVLRWRRNGSKICSKTLEAATKNLQHVTLLQGTKAYGAHVGPIPIPARERD